MQLKVELKDINSFIQIARAGSLTRAAATANLPKSTLNNSVRRLEDVLEVQLFIRKSSRMTLTDAGRAYLEQCDKIFDSCEQAATAAQRAHNEMTGRVRIAASIEFGTAIVGAATHFLATEYPSIDFELRLVANDSTAVDHLEFDCQVHVGRAPESDFMCRKMGDVSYGVYASPALLEEHPKIVCAADLTSVPGVEHIKFGLPEPWRVAKKGDQVDLQFHRRFRVNDYWTAKHYAIYGDAFAYLPDFFVHYEVEQGSLLPVLPKQRPDETAVWVIYPAARHKNPRVMRIVDALCENFDKFTLNPGYSPVKPPE